MPRRARAPKVASTRRRFRRWSLSLLIVARVAIAGGAYSVLSPAGVANEPSAAAPSSPPPTLASQSMTLENLPDGTFVGIAISGGGSRAANFGAAALQELSELGLVDAATMISSVSGGSLPAAYYGWRRPRTPGAWAAMRTAMGTNFFLAAPIDGWLPLVVAALLADDLSNSPDSVVSELHNNPIARSKLVQARSGDRPASRILFPLAVELKSPLLVPAHSHYLPLNHMLHSPGYRSSMQKIFQWFIDTSAMPSIMPWRDIAFLIPTANTPRGWAHGPRRIKGDASVRRAFAGQHRMPQHPARHHAPADQLVSLADLEIEWQIPRHAHGLADLHVGARPRVRVAEREHHRLAPTP